MIRFVEQKNEKHGINAAANDTMLKVDLRMSLGAFQWAPLPLGKEWVAELHHSFCSRVLPWLSLMA